MSMLPARADRLRSYRGSALLASCGARVARVALVVVLMWGLTGWAMGWWRI